MSKPICFMVQDYTVYTYIHQTGWGSEGGLPYLGMVLFLELNVIQTNHFFLQKEGGQSDRVEV